MSLFYRVVQHSTGALLRLFFNHKVILKEGSSTPQGAIIASNHLSFLDPPLIAASWPEPITFLARGTLFENPLLKFFITRLNACPVGKGSDLAAMKLACKLLEKGEKILIFPEGTRSNDGHLAPFKRGIAMLAMRTKAPIIPTYIHGTFEIWPKGQKLPSLSIAGKKTICIFGKPLYFDEYAKMEENAIIERIQQEIINLQQGYLHGTAEQSASSIDTEH